MLLDRREVPAPRRDAALVYDAARERVLLFGGRGDTGLFGDTWAFNLAARGWEQLDTGTGPQPRFSVVAGMDVQRDRFIDSDEPLARTPARGVDETLNMDFEAAIEHLPSGARRVFVLHDVEGYKHHEIAEMLNVTSGTTKAQLHRARMTLRKHLDR